MVVGGNGDSIYSRLMAAVGRQDMGADNPDYADNSRRCEREEEINEVRPPSVASLWMQHDNTVVACSAG